MTLVRRPLPMPGHVPDPGLRHLLMHGGVVSMRPGGAPMTRTSLDLGLRCRLRGLLDPLGCLLWAGHRRPLLRLQFFNPLPDLLDPLIGTPHAIPRLLIAIR
ncbi:hypothetical protein Psi01_85990 [Planobispora siamensis]|uniref:Uncharacterized protein n=1 Tax=Planobispora siamensis TaxID=936338 RepID=A0A8J3WP41_9ACTN|nr:hypothetical protein [Planobispora siamensis]GIH97969.1 hypothetical protein Psi01_85990 [Planobispora siamensis]